MHLFISAHALSTKCFSLKHFPSLLHKAQREKNAARSLGLGRDLPKIHQIHTIGPAGFQHIPGNRIYTQVEGFLSLQRLSNAKFLTCLDVGPRQVDTPWYPIVGFQTRVKEKEKGTIAPWIYRIRGKRSVERSRKSRRIDAEDENARQRHAVMQELVMRMNAIRARLVSNCRTSRVEICRRNRGS